MSFEYEIRLRKDGRGANLISEKLPYGALWYVNHLPAKRTVCALTA